MASKNLACLLGFHEWKKQYISPDMCFQVQVCQRCGREQEQVQEKHKWSKWEYEVQGSCTQVKVCKRCDDELIKESHNFDEWKYEKPHSCTQVRVCQRCGEELYRTKHKWPRWEEKSFGRTHPEFCHFKEKTCRRCGEYRKGHYTLHNWGEEEWNCWDYDHDWFERTCSTCGAVKGSPFGDF